MQVWGVCGAFTSLSNHLVLSQQQNFAVLNFSCTFEYGSLIHVSRKTVAAVFHCFNDCHFIL